MTTIVLNTLSGAVSEYDWSFQSITPEHAGSGVGLYALGGDTDDSAPIVASAVTGKKLFGASLHKLIAMVFFSLKGSGTSTLTVAGESGSWSYPFPVQSNGVSRQAPGRGIRENYLSFGYSNTDGAAFELDRIEVQSANSTSRRT